MKIGEMSSNDFEAVIHDKLFCHDENSIGKRRDLNSACQNTIHAKIRKYDNHPKNTCGEGQTERPRASEKGGMGRPIL